MTNDDLIFRHRVRLFARAGEIGAAGACRELGYHRSWYYRWKLLVERHGLEILMPRERGAGPGCPTNWRPSWSSRKWPWRWGARDWVRGDWRRNCGGTGSPPGKGG